MKGGETFPSGYGAGFDNEFGVPDAGEWICMALIKTDGIVFVRSGPSTRAKSSRP